MLVGHFVGKLKSIDSFDLPLTKELMQVLIASDFTCSCCGFRSRPSKQVLTGYMLPLPVSDGFKVFCALCAGAKMLNVTYQDNELGKLIYAPKLTQKNISDAFRICSGLTIMGAEQTSPVKISRANRILSELKSPEMMVDANVNPFFNGDHGSTLPLGDLLSYCGERTKKEYHKLVTGIRFLPEIRVYNPVITYYLHANPIHFAGA